MNTVLTRPLPVTRHTAPEPPGSACDESRCTCRSPSRRSTALIASHVVTVIAGPDEQVARDQQTEP